MAYEHKEGRGSLFKADREDQVLSGSFKLNGKDYWLNVWKKEEGKTHWGITVRMKEAAKQPTDASRDAAQPVRPQEPAPMPDALDDEVPF